MVKKRVYEFRHGMIKATVVERTHRKGGNRHTIDVVRLFRNGDKWQESRRFSAVDLPLIRLVLDEAYGWILIRKQCRGEHYNDN